MYCMCTCMCTCNFSCSSASSPPSKNTDKTVSRRYKHYDWLHDRLVEKFTINCVPPLPDKQYYGTSIPFLYPLTTCLSHLTTPSHPFTLSPPGEKE